MEYIYAALILHKAGKPVDEAGLKKVVEAAGIQPDEGKIKALIASLEGVDIGKTLEEAKSAPVAAAPAASAPVAGGEDKAKKEEKEKEEKKEEAAEGLSALFG